MSMDSPNKESSDCSNRYYHSLETLNYYLLSPQAHDYDCLYSSYLFHIVSVGDALSNLVYSRKVGMQSLYVFSHTSIWYSVM
jgi:hypothetical protein